jgi:hypothetical protein
MSIKNIMITNVNTQYTAEYIANALLKKTIAKVSSITLIPQITNGEISNIAYVDIDTYCDTEAAYEFISKLKSEFFKFCHDDTYKHYNLWIIQKNIHNSGGLCVGTYTTKFTHFNELDNISMDTNYDNEWQEFINERPIQGLGFDCYSVSEANEHLELLNQKLYTTASEYDILKIQEEIDHLENELRFQFSLENSYNVTLRPYQYNNNFCEMNTFPTYAIWRNENIRSVSDLSV